MSAAMEDPRLLFLRRIDLAQTRVKLSDEPILLLCGGKVPEKDSISPKNSSANSIARVALKALESLPILRRVAGGGEKPDGSVISLRHAFIKHQYIATGKTKFYFRMPEEVTNWEFNGIFENLIEFEKELGYICSLIMIILESAGSIAELGAFSQIPTLKNKILVIKSAEFHNSSFIELGLLRLINSNRTDEEGVKRYPWSIDRPGSIGAELPQDLTSTIEELLDRQSKTQVWKHKDKSHHIVLICEILNLFRALKRSEIKQYLNDLNIPITDSELKQKIFLLEEFGVIKKVSYGSDFYMRTNREFHQLHFHYKVGGAIDQMRLKADCMQFYNNASSENRHRLKAISRVNI